MSRKIKCLIKKHNSLVALVHYEVSGINEEFVNRRPFFFVFSFPERKSSPVFEECHLFLKTVIRVCNS